MSTEDVIRQIQLQSRQVHDSPWINVDIPQKTLPSNQWKWIEDDWTIAPWEYATDANHDDWRPQESPECLVRRRVFTRLAGIRDLVAELTFPMDSPNVKDTAKSRIRERIDVYMRLYDADGDEALNKEELLTMLYEEKIDIMAPRITKPVFYRQDSADDPSICSICYENEVNCCLLPCGHYVLCMECGEEWLQSNGECIMCRKSITSIVRTVTS